MKVFVCNLAVILAILSCAIIVHLSPAFAQEVTASTQSLPQEAAKPNPFQFVLGTVNFFLLGFMVFYLIVLKPSQKRDEDQSRFLKELKRNDEVVTQCCLLGKVSQVNPYFITVDLGNNLKVNVLPTHLSPKEKKPVAISK